MVKYKQKIVDISLGMFNDGLVAATSGNVSLRFGDFVAITPSGMDYRLMKADDIAVLSLSGEIVEGACRPSSETPMHLEIYRQCPHINAIVHTHSPYATAFAVLREEIPFILIEMAEIGYGVPCSPFAPAGTRELGEVVASTLQNSPCALLANHGAVAIGNDLEQAFTRAVYLEDSARIYHLARAIGAPKILEKKEKSND